LFAGCQVNIPDVEMSLFHYLRVLPPGLLVPACWKYISTPEIAAFPPCPKILDPPLS